MVTAKSCPSLGRWFPPAGDLPDERRDPSVAAPAIGQCCGDKTRQPHKKGSPVMAPTWASGVRKGASSKACWRACGEYSNRICWPVSASCMRQFRKYGDLCGGCWVTDIPTSTPLCLPMSTSYNATLIRLEKWLVHRKHRRGHRLLHPPPGTFDEQEQLLLLYR